jgi:hypothetical protein
MNNYRVNERDCRQMIQLHSPDNKRSSKRTLFRRLMRFETLLMPVYLAPCLASEKQSLEYLVDNYSRVKRDAGNLI